MLHTYDKPRRKMVQKSDPANKFHLSPSPTKSKGRLHAADHRRHDYRPAARPRPTPPLPTRKMNLPRPSESAPPRGIRCLRKSNCRGPACNRSGALLKWSDSDSQSGASMSSQGSVTNWLNQLQAGDSAAAQKLWERYYL